MTYSCIPCDRHFKNSKALLQHLDSPAHDFDRPECSKSFGSNRARQQHLDSPAHKLDSTESSKSLSSKQAVQQHLQFPEYVSATTVEYIGIPRSVVSPVYKAAIKFRFRQPTVDDIIRHTKTELDSPIVSALIAAALRLLPIDNTPLGVALRTEKSRARAAASKQAEDGFCAKLSRRGLIYLRENQQQGEASTPDVRFKDLIPICGHLCLWLEYKNYFGF